VNRPPVWVARLASRFWSEAVTPPPFPRDLAACLTWFPDISCSAIPDLTLSRAAMYLTTCGIPFSTSEPERRLRGFLYAHGGAGIIFIDAADDMDEQRFSIAHELAHYLRDYLEPRRLAEKRLGPTILDVLDGKRQPTPDERLSAVLRGVTVGCHTHLLARDERGRPASAAERDAEIAADRLAFELLAPFDALGAEPINVDDLEMRFGLPAAAARTYAAHLTATQSFGNFAPHFPKDR